mmetsp:Transcript_21037/g.37551  ORF Transcript_21037/g.37551 Transcript_21037/m.37551 type:complete len:141 (-) Transcript_21037:744-1166(-)
MKAAEFVDEREIGAGNRKGFPFCGPLWIDDNDDDDDDNDDDDEHFKPFSENDSSPFVVLVSLCVLPVVPGSSTVAESTDTPSTAATPLNSSFPPFGSAGKSTHTPRKAAGRLRGRAEDERALFRRPAHRGRSSKSKGILP